MARIRSVKPEFWTDPEVVALPMAARLFFIGSWNHADDYGVLKDDPDRLKLQILPADDVNPHDLIDELVKRDLLLRRTAPDGTPLLVIRTFCAHQKIDRRSPGRWGHPESFSNPPNPTSTTTEPDEDRSAPTNPHPSPPRTGTEGTGTEGTSTTIVESTALALVAPDGNPSTDLVQTVFDEWVRAAGKTGRTQLDPKRRRLIQKALGMYPLDDVLAAVRGWKRSKWHRGENPNGTVYNDLGLLLRDAEHIEAFRDIERHPPGQPVSDKLRGVVAWLQKETA